MSETDATATDRAFEQLVETALERAIQLGTAESMTGGEVAYLITRQPGSGDVFAGGVVTYQTRVKQAVLDVPEGPVVSHPAARAMAEGARRLLDCDFVVSITGVAGPERQDGQPVGCVFIGTALRGEPADSTQHFFEGDPDAIREAAAATAARIGHEVLSRLPVAT